LDTSLTFRGHYIAIQVQEKAVPDQDNMFVIVEKNLAPPRRKLPFLKSKVRERRLLQEILVRKVRYFTTFH
jgi:hypothetical protein